MGESYRCFIRVSSVGMITLVAVFSALLLASRWLPSSDVETSADAIVVLAGDSRRTLYAADLFQKGLAPRVLLSRPIIGVREGILASMGISVPAAEEYEKMILLNKGVPDAAISHFGDGSISTYEEALELSQRYFDQTPALLVVTSPYHVRRARLILENAMPAARIHVVATPYEQFPDHWWRSQDSARNLLFELIKTIFFAMGGRYVASAE